MISLLASISGLLGAILIIAIACVLRTKRRRSACCRTRNRRRPHFSSSNRLTGVNPGLLNSTIARNGTNGSLVQQDMGRLTDVHGADYTNPPGGINLSVLLEDWQPGQDANSVGGNGFPPEYHRYHAVDFPGGPTFCVSNPRQTHVSEITGTLLSTAVGSVELVHLILCVAVERTLLVITKLDKYRSRFFM